MHKRLNGFWNQNISVILFSNQLTKRSRCKHRGKNEGQVKVKKDNNNNKN